jgi:hypothetical protein
VPGAGKSEAKQFHSNAAGYGTQGRPFLDLSRGNGASSEILLLVTLFVQAKIREEQNATMYKNVDDEFMVV